MLKDARVGATIPTTDLARARAFYEQKLGLTPEDNPAGGAMYRCGEGTAFAVFPSSGKSSGTHTQLGFDVTDIAAEVAALAALGINPEPFDMPGATTVDGVTEVGDGKAAWYKDPDGNLLGLFQRAEVAAAAS